jgi:hypothetical protein
MPFSSAARYSSRNSTALKSRWFVGSSERRTVGRGQDRRASIARFFWPPESSESGRPKSALSKPRPESGLLDLRDHLVSAFVLEAVGDRVVAVVDERELSPSAIACSSRRISASIRWRSAKAPAA